MTEEVISSKFKRGDRVVNSRINFKGVVNIVFKKQSGAIQVVVEHDRGWCAIMDEAELEHIEYPATG